MRGIDRPASEVWAVSARTVDDAGLRVTCVVHDRSGVEILARRTDGSEVRVRVTGGDEGRSEVSLHVGGGDRIFAAYLTERIAEHLGLTEPAAPSK